MSPINSLSSSFMQSILGSGSSASKSKSATEALSVSPQPEKTQLSPLAQSMSQLQQLQQSDPTKYQQVTQQIATNLQAAAQSAQTAGNPAAAAQLNQLATNFTKASQSGQMPDTHDLAKAAGGHHHHHSGHAAFQTSAFANDSPDPAAIITNTLAASQS